MKRSMIALSVLSVAFAAAAAEVALPLSDETALAKARAVVAKMNLDQKVSLLGGVATMYLKAMPEVGITNEWAMSDCSHAIKPEHLREYFGYVDGVDNRCVVLPALSAVAMTWNAELAAAQGDVMGEQMRGRGKDQILGPGVNIIRNPLCGRNWEYLSEDPFLNAKLVVPYIRAAQKWGVATTVKHFCLNNQELERYSMDSVVDERTLNEIYLPAFYAAVKEAGTISLMTSYNKVNGIFASENAYLQLGILRDRWGFKGCIVTDWGGQHSTVAAALGGGNLEMSFGRGIVYFTDHFNNRLPLADAVCANLVPETTVDDMVLRVVFMMAKTGFLDGIQPKGALLTERHHRVAREIGDEAIVLLKNAAGALPLDRDRTRKVVVLGNQSNLKFTHLGGSCESRAEYEITCYEGLKEYLGPEAEVKLFPLGAEGIADRYGSRIPMETLETFKPSVDGSAFVDRAWEVYTWPRGEEWRNNMRLTGYTEYPTGHKHEAIRYVAKVKAPETGVYFLVIKPTDKIREATLFVDGKVVYTLYNQEPARTPFTMKQGEVHTFQIDVAGCAGEDAFELGWLTQSNFDNDIAVKRKACETADAVIAFTGTQIGWGAAHESEGKDMPNMKEPSGHDEEIEELLKWNLGKFIVVNRSSTPMEMPWADKVKTLVEVPYLGQEGGRSFARVLFGETNPSGKLAVTWPRSYEDTPCAVPNAYGQKFSAYLERFYVGYRWYDKNRIEPLFPFGYGLSYTKFKLGDAVKEKSVENGRQVWKVWIDVKNVGKVAGKETVQLYMAPVDPKVERCAKELKGFAKTKLLAPGETERLALKVNVRDLAYYDTFLHRWHAERGEYDFLVGTSSADLNRSVRVYLDRDIVFEE